ncbi:MAG: hypothetical protein FWG99_06180 [Treponema sp.]|nr:hypothetical protein [Treponema sp.]
MQGGIIITGTFKDVKPRRVVFKVFSILYKVLITVVVIGFAIQYYWARNKPFTENHIFKAWYFLALVWIYCTGACLIIKSKSILKTRKSILDIIWALGVLTAGVFAVVFAHYIVSFFGLAIV